MIAFRRFMLRSLWTRLQSATPGTHCLLILLLCIQPIFGKDRSGQQFKYNPKSGDIVFQRSKSPLGPAIEIATGSYVTHVGITIEDNDTMFVYEAVGPVRRVPLSDWIRLGVDEHICVKRLKDNASILVSEVLDKMRREFARLKGRDYDVQFNWSDDRLYCSELVYKIFRRAAGIELGRIERFGEFKLDDPTVQFWIKTYFPNGPNLDEKVVSPVSIYEDTSLVTVYSTSGWRSGSEQMPERR